MKRDRFESEYERIRREAGMARRPEFPEEEQPDASGRLRQERIAASLDDFHRRMTALNDAERVQTEQREAEMDAWRAVWRERFIRREYEVRGLTPPEPPEALGLLLQLGWRVEQSTEGPVLVRPPAPAGGKRKTREQYAEESLKEGF